MTAREDLIDIVTRDPQSSGGDTTWATDLIDAHRTEVFNEAISALQGLYDLNPNSRRADQMAFSVGVLMGARDFPGEVPSTGGGIAVNPFTDRVYRDAYATGRDHAGASGWVLAEFAAVFTTSDGSDRPVSELRHRPCGGLVQGVGPHTLIDLMALASRHKCQTTTEGGSA